MYKAPERFEAKLHRLFEGRLRIRWSTQKGEWNIEYKVAPGKVLGFPIRSDDDRAIRARDGYALVLAVRNGDRMPCPRCGYEIKVPVMQLGEAKCTYCIVAGRDGRYPACYFPLDGDQLLDYLARMDPQRTWRDGIAKLADKANERLLKSRERAFENIAQAAIKDELRNLFQIQGVGYTGKVFTGGG